MGRGGYRPGAGRPKSGQVTTQVEVARQSVKADMTPLEYMLHVLNDANVDDARRDKMAIASAPYIHAKADETKEGKKAQRQANAESASSSGRFSASRGPKLAVDNSR